jgi:dienelactone hydrolase
MKKKYTQFIQLLKGGTKAITPGQNAVRGAALGLLITTSVLWLIYSFGTYTNLNDQWVLLVGFAFVLAAVLFGFVSRWVVKLLSKIPATYKLALFITIPLLFIISFDWLIPVVILVLSSLCGAAFLVLKETGFNNLSRSKKVITVLGAILGFGGFIVVGVLYNQDGFEVDPITNAAISTESTIQQITAVSPAQKGSYAVKTLTYGSGKDLHRPEYGEKVSIKTTAVNGLAFIDSWEGFGGWWREKYWGFNAKSLPINARVWYPEGDGPFPLALIVHGNHNMQDYSDPGYEYLGELLASKGIILASVDENFINYSWSDIFGGLDTENDARGWLLLEHLKVWHEWNKTADNIFYKKIDTSNLALIGHSRGGEAVAHAAMFNKLPFYPDDASVKFDFNYNIKSIVAIAPVDGQYESGESRTVIEDTNYFVIHGAQDADVSSFMGSQQYERVKFEDSLYHFKSGVYVYGANHGQFNTSWGNNDIGGSFSGLLNLKQLISAEDQMEIAKVYISSFLDITLKNKREYLPLFVDARKGKDWLPKTIYLNQFEDSKLKTVANFDEDFDVSTTTQGGGKVKTKNLSVWREQEIELKWQKKGSRALFVGWDYDLKNEKESIKSVPDSLIASYTINFSSTAIDSSSVLTFSIAESKESSNPKSEGKWVKNKSEKDKDEESKDKDEKEEDKDDQDEPKKPIDFTIQLSDASGQTVSFLLSNFSPLQRVMEVMIMKAGFVLDDKESEKVFQTYYFPTKKFQKINPSFTPSSIGEIKFLFNKNESGVIAIDNIGFMKDL